MRNSRECMAFQSALICYYEIVDSRMSLFQVYI